MREPGSGVRKMLEAMLLPHLGGMNLQLELGSGEAVREAVRLGLGISCGSKRAIAQELERGEFVAIPLPNIPMERRFYIVWHAEKRLTAGAERLRTACHAMMNNPPGAPQLRILNHLSHRCIRRNHGSGKCKATELRKLRRISRKQILQRRDSLRSSAPYDRRSTW